MDDSYEGGDDILISYISVDVDFWLFDFVDDYVGWDLY